jgi:hypothetical protein
MLIGIDKPRPGLARSAIAEGPRPNGGPRRGHQKLTYLISYYIFINEEGYFFYTEKDIN